MLMWQMSGQRVLEISATCNNPAPFENLLDPRNHLAIIKSLSKNSLYLDPFGGCQRKGFWDCHLVGPRGPISKDVLFPLLPLLNLSFNLQYLFEIFFHSWQCLENLQVAVGAHRYRCINLWSKGASLHLLCLLLLFYQCRLLFFFLS